MSSSGNDSAFKEKHDEAVQNEGEAFERIMCIPTLPKTFKSLVGKIIEIETEDPQHLIELLGELLGITDYKINKAAFWFLDTIALQLLRYKNHLDDHYKVVFISWLAGEIILIRDKRLLREDFFKEMQKLFLFAVEKLSTGYRLPYWELLMDEYIKIIEKAKKKIRKSISKELLEKSYENPPQNNKYLSVKKSLKVLFDSKKKENITNLQEKPTINFTNSPITKKLQMNKFTNTITETSNLIDFYVLDIIIEATYSMYANELRYALVHAVFVTPIPLEIHIRHTLRVPRPIKRLDPQELFDIQLYEQLQKSAASKFTHKKYKDAAELLTPPSSLVNDEDTLAYNRQFILPLTEAKEAAQMFGIYRVEKAT